MRCNEIKYYLNDYADGHLINEMRKEIKNHLDFCSDCNVRYNDIIALLNEAQPRTREISPSKDLWEGISERTTGKKKPAKVFAIHSERNSFYELKSSRPLLFKDPKKKKGGWFVIVSAISAVILGVVIGILYYTQSSSAFWTVEKLSGTPVVGTEELKESGILKVGDWLQTDKNSRARLKVGVIGEVDVLPGSKIKLVETNPAENRIELDWGKINAAIWAPPKLFFVEIPSTTVIDLGCMYTLEVAEDGSGILKVNSGWAALQSGEIKSLVPAEAICKTKKSFGPGTPYFDDAASEFKSALDEFDFGKNKDDALSVILKVARKKDALSLWHILSKVKDEKRKRIFDRLAELIEIPTGITQDGIMNGNKEMMDVLWESLGYGSRKLFKL